MPLAIHATSPPRTHFRHERLAELQAEVHYLPPQKIIRAHVLRAERSGQWPPAIIGQHEQRYGKRFRPEPRARHALAIQPVATGPHPGLPGQ